MALGMSVAFLSVVALCRFPESSLTHSTVSPTDIVKVFGLNCFAVMCTTLMAFEEVEGELACGLTANTVVPDRITTVVSLHEPCGLCQVPILYVSFVVGTGFPC